MRKLFSNKWIYYIEKHRVASSVIKMAFFAHRGISIKLVEMDVHIMNETLSLKFHPYSILSKYTIIGFLIYCVLDCGLSYNVFKMFKEFPHLNFSLNI